MKKIIAMIIACMLCVGMLSACGEKSSGTSQSTSSTNSTVESKTESTAESINSNIVEAEIGTILDKPEIIPTTETFYVDFSYASDANETGIETMEIAMDDTSDPGILYVTNGSLKLNEVVYELSSDGVVTKYTKDTFSENFAKDATTSQADLVKEKDNMVKLLATVGFGFTSANPDYKYKKCKSEKAVFTGDAFVYECVNGDDLFGKIWVDQKTGLIVKMTGKDNEKVMTVQQLKTSDLGIPQYK